MTALKKEQDQFDEVYDKIVKLYDHAENILKTATHKSVEDQEAFLSEIEPLVEQIEESANTIAEDFTRVIESGEEPTNAVKIRVSSALRKILFSIEEYKNHVNVYEAQEE